MGKIKGQKHYLNFKKGIKLTRQQAINANCYQCNGYEESRKDCRILDCPLRAYSPHKHKISAEE